jgi:hypothetical protein
MSEKRDDGTGDAGFSSAERSDNAALSNPMSVEGVLLFARMIIEQGRVQEFLEACQKEGFTTLAGPVGLVAFSRTFVAEGPANRALPSSARVEIGPQITAVRGMVKRSSSKIDSCQC